MKRFSLLIITFFLAHSVFGVDTDSTSRVKFKFGGRIDLMGFYDSYESIDQRGGAQYLFPKAPIFNSVGSDINFANRFRMSMAPTRFHASITVPELLGATGRGYVEIDFMGNGDAVVNMPRLRHAYFALDWARQSLLLGQTSHLVLMDDPANTVSFGSGWPFNPLSRPVQIRFSQKLAVNGQFDIALAMFTGSQSTAQSYAVLPDLHARFLFGNPKRLSAGVAAGASLLKPRTITADSTRATSQVLAWDASMFLKYRFAAGHSITIFGMYGTNLSRFDMIGGYAPLLADVNSGVQDYGYQAIGTLSLWVDYQTKQWKGWQLGLFAGLQQNTGTNQEVNTALATTPHKGVNNFWRVAPRIYYNYKNSLTFGLEYLYTMATWTESYDKNFRPSAVYNNTFNNRVTLLARFKF